VTLFGVLAYVSFHTRTGERRRPSTALDRGPAAWAGVGVATYAAGALLAPRDPATRIYVLAPVVFLAVPATLLLARGVGVHIPWS